VGFDVGAAVGFDVGAAGFAVGAAVGFAVGAAEAAAVGATEATLVGAAVACGLLEAASNRSISELSSCGGLRGRPGAAGGASELPQAARTPNATLNQRENVDMGRSYTGAVASPMLISALHSSFGAGRTGPGEAIRQSSHGSSPHRLRTRRVPWLSCSLRGVIVP
jgi:hypothetical protein